MKLPKFKKGYAPKYKLDQKVWIIGGRDYAEDNIRSILLELGPGKDGPILFCTGYTLSTINPYRTDYAFSQREVYATKREAARLAKWHPVSGISEKQWKQAIGDRHDEEDENIEDCELGICCGIVSDQRDLFLKCKKLGGLIERDVRELRNLIENHEYPMPKGKRPKILDKILAQLGIVIKEKQNEP